ncbi:MAG: hypothetical protein PHO26_02545 [Dehalococcoidia bacterium]|nr:hypothetical protein [Dehalococcoidia bacterium]MDD5495188.1 hypothetical protein [Dehalococcoidia bacterium]
MFKGEFNMPSECVECGGKTDCDSIICASCLAEIIDRVNAKNQAEEKIGIPSNKVKVG